MCIGPLAPPKPPPMPKPQGPAPTVKAAAPQAEYVEPKDLKDEEGDDEKMTTKKKKALEIKKTKEGVKEFSAIDEKSMPQGPEGGVNTPQEKAMCMMAPMPTYEDKKPAPPIEPGPASPNDKVNSQDVKNINDRSNQQAKRDANRGPTATSQSSKTDKAY